MKRALRRVTPAALLLAGVVALARSAPGQGDLNPPPGAPTPTLKSLEQVRPRVIVNATNTPGDANSTFIISAPGAYYLAGNITGDAGKNGITIAANDVSLDLNGFSLISGGGPIRGITISGLRSGFSIRNGTVSGWADGGVRTDGAKTIAERLRLADNVEGVGLNAGIGSTVRNCVASNNRTGFSCLEQVQFIDCIATVNLEDGFHSLGEATYLDCTASRNGRVGIWAEASSTILRCSVSRSDSDGIVALNGSLVANCTADSNLSRGIYTSEKTTVRHCTAFGNQGDGILAATNCVIVGNVCAANGGGGIWAGSGTRVQENDCSGNAIGFNIFDHCLLTANSAHGNATNFSTQPTTVTGPIVDMSLGGTITSVSPDTNFIY